MDPGGPLFDSREHLAEHEAVVTEVHRAGGRIALQILHAGRYARVPDCVSPSPGKARINAFAPRPLGTQEVWDTVERFADTAALAKEAGYDGVEIMGSEGYLLNEFTAAITNQRDDAFGGCFDRRIRFPLEILKAVRARVGEGFVVIYRISSIDLMEGGMTADEIAGFARRVEQAGADMINTGVGWHESAVPTIAASVPRAAWTAAVRNVKRAVSIPVMASNRINAPEVAEAVLASGAADLVSMAGRSLGKSTGWILKAKLRKANVEMVAGATYEAIDDQGLHYSVKGERRLLEVDNVIVCAGQQSNRALQDALRSRGIEARVIGGADVASELDAVRAIDQATRLAVSL